MKNYNKEVTIEVELPGYNKNDIIVAIQNKRLIIKAKKEHSHKKEAHDFYHEESSKNAFEYTTTLPPVDSKRMKWHLMDGILTIKIPKRR